MANTIRTNQELGLRIIEDEDPTLNGLLVYKVWTKDPLRNGDAEWQWYATFANHLDAAQLYDYLSEHRIQQMRYVADKYENLPDVSYE